MEWAVLQFAAGVTWPWIAAGTASQYALDLLYPVVFRMFGQLSTAQYNYVYLGLRIILSIPAAGVLAYYTRRGWLWIAAAPLGFVLGRVWHLFIPLPTTYSPGLSGSTLTLRLIIGVAEGALLAYILDERIKARSAGVQVSAAKVDAPAFPIGTAVLMVISLAAFGFLSFAEFPERDRSIASFSRGIAISQAAGLILLAVPRLRAIGVGLGFGAALIAVVPTTFFGGFAILMGAVISIIPVLIVSQIALVIVGFLAVRRQPPEDRGIAWLAGIVVPMALVVGFTSWSV